MNDGERMSDEISALLKTLNKQEVTGLARLLTLVERQGPSALKHRELVSPKGAAFRLGITGPPGAGKSTLIGQLIPELRKRQLSVGVIAVDPSSPFSQGAILGDRIRYSEYVGDDTLEDGDTFVLAVDLPLGARVQYWVDKMSHLPVKVRSTVTIDGETHEFERTMADFQRFDGVMYPTSFTYPGRDGEPMAGSFVSVEVNVPLDEARFAYPEGA